MNILTSLLLCSSTLKVDLSFERAREIYLKPLLNVIIECVIMLKKIFLIGCSSVLKKFTVLWEGQLMIWSSVIPLLLFNHSVVPDSLQPHRL